MGVRETLNKQPAIVTGATLGIVVLALLFIIYQLTSSGRPRIPTKAYFSDDDGASYFSDDINLLAPFDHGGKEAVKANVFKCGDKTFVGYLERFTPVAQKQITDARSTNNMGELTAALAIGTQVKAPLTGDKGWVTEGRPAATKLELVSCPDGSVTPPEPVVP
jgi:hypothetical protein